MNFVCWFVTLDTCMGSLGYSWFWVSKTHSHLDTHKILREILHHNSKLFWVKHTKETRTSWQAVCWPQIRPLVTLSVFVQMFWLRSVLMGGFTLPVWELEEMGERPRSVRGIPKIISADCTERSHKIWYWAYDVLWNWHGLLTVSSVMSNISSKLWGTTPHHERDERRRMMKVWKSRVRFFVRSQSDGGIMVNIRALLALIEYKIMKNELK